MCLIHTTQNKFYLLILFLSHTIHLTAVTPLPFSQSPTTSHLPQIYCSSIYFQKGTGLPVILTKLGIERYKKDWAETLIPRLGEATQ